MRWCAITHGVWLAVLLSLAVHSLLLHHYEVWLNRQRVLLLLLLCTVALPAHGLLVQWVGWAARGRRSAAAACFLLLAAITAVSSGQLFERMAMLPGFLLAAVLVMSAAHCVGHPRSSPLSSAVFAALTISWLGAVVCALY